MLQLGYTQNEYNRKFLWCNIVCDRLQFCKITQLYSGVGVVAFTTSTVISLLDALVNLHVSHHYGNRDVITMHTLSHCSYNFTKKNCLHMDIYMDNT